MTTLLLKTADLLDAMAAAEDARPAPAAAPSMSGAVPTADGLIHKLASRVGDGIPEEIRAKLAADPALRSYLEPILNAHEEPRAMGGPSEKAASPASEILSPEEELRRANALFVETVMGHRS